MEIYAESRGMFVSSLLLIQRGGGGTSYILAKDVGNPDMGYKKFSPCVQKILGKILVLMPIFITKLQIFLLATFQDVLTSSQ